MRLERKQWLPLAILGGGIAAVGLLVATRPVVEPRAPEVVVPLVRATSVVPEKVQLSVHAQGTVVPRTESELVPQVSGVVGWISPALVSGGFFAEGDPLVRIDPADYEVELETARAVVARVESELARARKERDRQRQLAGQSVASQSRIDDAENAFRVAEAGAREARARLARAERDLDRTELRAPYDGRVRQKQVDVGQFVNRGSPIARLYAVDYAEVRLPVPDRELSFLDLSLAPGQASGGPDAEAKSGPRVVLSAQFAGRRGSWSGRIVRTEGEIDPRSRMVNVVARVEDPYGRASEGDGPPLAVGLFVDAEIEGRILADAVVLPRSALRDGDVVLVLDQEDRLEFRPVDVMRTERDRIFIGGGLEAGERVCISPLRAPVEGMQVRVAGEEPGEDAA